MVQNKLIILIRHTLNNSQDARDCLGSRRAGGRAEIASSFKMYSKSLSLTKVKTAMLVVFWLDTKSLYLFIYLFIYQLGLSLKLSIIDRSKKENKSVWNGTFKHKVMKCK